jgi:hypothetical protein
MRWPLSIVLLLGAALPAWKPSARPAAPFYSTDVLDMSALRKLHEQDARKMLYDAMESRVRTLGHRGADGSITMVATSKSRYGLWELPGPPAAFAARVDCRAHAGAEFDLVFPQGERLVPVTVTCVSAADVVVEWGAEMAAWRSGPADRAAVATRWGLGPIVDGEAPWSDAEVHRLDDALSLLPAADRAWLADIEFVRNVKQNPALRVDHAAWYELNAEGRQRIVVLASAFAADSIGFVGDPAAPRPRSVTAFAHEIGHSLVRVSLVETGAEAAEAAAKSRAVYETQVDRASEYDASRARLMEEIDAYNVRVAALREQSDAYNAEARRLTKSGGTEADSVRMAEARAALDTESEALDAIHRGLTAQSEELDAKKAEFDLGRDEQASANAEVQAKSAEAEDLLRRSPLLAAFAALPGAGKGPTPYGRTSLDESFAESYALFVADPAALQRVAPEIHGWFATGGHLPWVEARTRKLPAGAAPR